MRRLLIIALLALAATPAAALADPAATWYFNRVAIPAGEVVEVPLTSGTNFTLVVKASGLTGVKYPCTVTGSEAFWNTPEGAARDETRSIAFACTGAAVVAYLPWTSTLLASETVPLLDRWEGMALEVNGELFTGSLDAKVGDVDPEGTKEKEGIGDLDNSVAWRLNAKRVLLAPSGNKSWLIGSFKLGTKEAGVTDEATDG